MTFELREMTKALVRSVNARAEMHGNDPVPAVDISVRVTGPNTLLDLFDPWLRTMLYKAADGSAPQDQLPGVEAVSDTPAMRSMVLEMPLKLSTQIVGRNLEIDYGTGGKSNLVIPTCSVNEFKVDALDGGSINLDFRIQASGLSEKVLGKLATLIRHDILLTLTVSEEAKQEPLPGTAEGGQTQEAGDAFAEAHAAGKTVPAKKAAGKKTPLAKKIARAVKTR